MCHEDPIDIALSKCKQAIGMIDKTDLSLKQDQGNVKKGGYMTNKVKKEFETSMQSLVDEKKKLCAIMLKDKDSLDLELVKTLIGDGIAVVKEVQGFIKQHRGISSAASQAGDACV